MKKQTAVEWLEERLSLSFGDDLRPLIGFFVLAKEMEKEQIVDAYETSHISMMTSEQYYTETYGG